MPFALLEGPDLIVVLLIVVVLFGGAKLPGLARSLGEAQREFRNATLHGGSGARPATAPSDEVTLSRAEFERLTGQHAALPSGQPADKPVGGPV